MAGGGGRESNPPATRNAAAILEPGGILLLEEGTDAEVTDFRVGYYRLLEGRGPGAAIGWRSGTSSGLLFRSVVPTSCSALQASRDRFPSGPGLLPRTLPPAGPVRVQACRQEGTRARFTPHMAAVPDRCSAKFGLFGRRVFDA